ncbi:class I adenylate-forming enzyme family protein [Hyphomonas oceanitis]|uniref:AMP-dependent synthetase/ligase n=1 Tax=Hyphomonas oceanitis SCH89 TaxID=1280953 RepID=A0A059G4M0_9PROT|nr:AMP-binding protein [Hyphomonas oceanitis]KDA01761.1 AMP-dependent synthetase/ligase [Hyphomonas oceanitis SCH89]|tara:strand:+ start:563 stop:2086 length:1524 start_codon:yes stop_codon:yes gene_type:complete
MSFLSDLLNGVLEIDPSADVIDFHDTWSTWGDLKRSIDAIKAALTELGLGEGARIGVMIRNHPDVVAAILSAVSVDGTMVSINHMLPEDKLRADLERLDLPVVIGIDEDFARPGLLDTLKAAGTAVIETQPVLKGARLRPGFEKITGANIRREQPGVIIEMLTSGTTGTPKRIPLQRDAFLQSFKSAMSYESDRSPDDPPRLRSGVQLLGGPMAHIGGLWHALSTILAGRKACIIEKFSVDVWRDAIVRHRPKVAGAVPTGLRMILDANLPREDLASLVALRTGAQPLDPAITQEFLDRYDLPVLQNYGATEFSGAVAGWSLGDFRKYYASKPGSVGKFQTGVKGRVVNAETGEELPRGEEGVLEMQARQFGNEGAWLRTTDRAVIDEDDFLFIKGRADNAILRGGFKVHPDDVNKVLEGHPAVREAVVVGIPDRRLGAVPVAAIMLKSGVAKPDAGELKAYAREHLIAYQVPVKFMFVDDVPRTPSLKPALADVRALFEDPIQATA